MSKLEQCMVLTFSLMQDPRASTSQSFTNMMTLDNDAAVELLMASDPTPSSGGKGVSRRGSGYIQCEDIQLCTSWMNISNDPIVGNEQPSKTYWNRIADDFHQNRDFDSNRSANSLEHRMGIILKDCMLFQACYEQIERRNPSGVPYQEHVLDLCCCSYILSLLYIYSFYCRNPSCYISVIADDWSSSKVC